MTSGGGRARLAAAGPAQYLAHGQQPQHHNQVLWGRLDSSLEAKAAWDSFNGEKTMEMANKLAGELNVKGG